MYRGRNRLDWLYASWNIETLPEGPVRRDLIDRLAHGGFPEIELAYHGMGFFTLMPDCHERYVSLVKELDGSAPCNPRENEKHPRLSYVTAFFAEAQKRGFKSAIGDMVHWAARKAKGEVDDEQRRAKDRGMLLPYVSACSADMADMHKEDKR